MSLESVIFRSAELTDLTEAALLIERANAQRDNQPLPTTLHAEDAVTDLHTKTKRPGAWTDIALIDHQLAGISLGYPVTEARDLPTEYCDGEYLSLLMVEPRHWGKRIASMLLDRATYRAQQNRRQQLLLLTREKDNEHARGVYEHKGFVLTGDSRTSKYGRQVLYLLDL